VKFIPLRALRCDGVGNKIEKISEMQHIRDALQSAADLTGTERPHKRLPIASSLSFPTSTSLAIWFHKLPQPLFPKRSVVDWSKNCLKIQLWCFLAVSNCVSMLYHRRKMLHVLSNLLVSFLTLHQLCLELASSSISSLSVTCSEATALS
jgi:hypothetical protein